VKPSLSDNSPTLTSTAPEAQDPRKKGVRRELTLNEKCALAVSMAAWLKLGCSGVQLHPVPDEPCPKEAIKAMREVLHWSTGDSAPEFQFIVDVKQSGGSPEDGNAVFTDGPVQGAMGQKQGEAPEGMLLDGHLWTSGDRIYGRYFQAHVPGKGTLPVCVEIYSVPHLGIKKGEGSKPGAVVGPATWSAVATRRYR
jgi:serine/threonine-protein kinase